MANILRKLRTDKGLTMQEASDKMGIDRSALSRLESGERALNEFYLKSLSNFYDVSTDYILGLSENKRPETKIVEKIVTVPSQDNSNFSPEHRAVLDLISRLDRDDLIMLKGMILALLSSRPQEQQRNKDII